MHRQQTRQTASENEHARNGGTNFLTSTTANGGGRVLRLPLAAPLTREKSRHHRGWTRTHTHTHT